MDNKYRVFDKSYNKILDMIESYVPNIYKKYTSLINLMDENVLDAISETDDFSTGNGKYKIDYMLLGDTIAIDYSLNTSFFSEILIRKLTEKDLFTMGLKKKIFYISKRNTEEKKDDLQFFYEEKDGKFNFIGTSDKENISIDCVWEVYLCNTENEYFLECKTLFRGIPIYNKIIPISFDEIYQYIDTEGSTYGKDDIDF